MTQGGHAACAAEILSSHDSSLRLRRAKPRMMGSKMLTWLRMDQKEALHSIRTAVAAVGSLLIAHLRHHFISEKFWFGVSKPSIDFVGGTFRQARARSSAAAPRASFMIEAAGAVRVP
jgi:hypothetical protein